MQAILNFGIDVAKAELVIGVVDHPKLNITISNNASAIKAWLRSVPVGSRIAVESTGEYHRLIVQLAQERGFETYVLNARDVHYYAKALGQRGKTDRTDAQVISRHLREHHRHLYPFKAEGPVEQGVNRLLGRRAVLVAQRNAVQKSMQGLDELAGPVRALVEQFDELMAAIDRQVAALIQSQADLANEFRQVQTAPGIGPQSGALLVCLFRRIGFTNADAVVAFTGLDPRPMDSGQKRGQRRLSKRGPPLLRRQLYMVGVSASKSKVFRPLYEALRAQGLSTTASFVILGRKLLRIAFAVWRNNSAFNVERYLGNRACAKL